MHAVLTPVPPRHWVKQTVSSHGTGVVFLDFAAFFFADLAEVGAADTVGAALMVGWFVGLLVLDPFFLLVFFCTRRSSVAIMLDSCATSEAVVVHDTKDDSPKASSSAADGRTLIVDR